MPKRGDNGARPRRVAQEVRQALCEMLTDGSIKDPRVVEAMATVTEVEMSPDLEHARVFVSVFSDDAAVKARVIEGLIAAVGVCQRILARKLRLRKTPRLRFELDESIDRGVRMSALLNDVLQD